MPQNLRNTMMAVITATGDAWPVAAATVTYDDRYMPAFLQLRDEDGRTVGWASMDKVALILRTDATTAAVPSHPKLPAASPAQIGALKAQSAMAGHP